MIAFSRTLRLASLAVLALGFAPLAGSCRSAYYSTMEKFGVHKRDILVDRVQEGREAQAEAQEQFLTTFERFQELTGFSGGELEETYGKLKKELDRCEGEAEDVRERISAIDRVATDLFAEWEGELELMQNPDLRSKSRASLEETRRSSEQLIGAMRRAESKMDPVLTAFRDQVLYLKHNLNAQAIASLQDTVVSIEADISALISDMERSIREADEFIASMGS